MGANRHTTLMLMTFVILLFGALVFTIYYLFFGGEKTFDFIKINNKGIEEEIYVSPLSSKRKNVVEIDGKEYIARIYKDGALGVMIYQEGEVAKKMQNTLILTGNIERTNIKPVDMTYEVKAGTDAETFFLVVRTDGRVYKINNEILYKYGSITFDKLEGLEKIARIYQTGVILENPKYSNANNVIAVDIKGNEYIITDLLLNKININPV